MMNYKDYKHGIKIQIRFKDVDLAGHVNNANHLTYFELARVDYFNEVISRKNDWKHTGMILARMEVDYRSPIMLDDEIYCFSKVPKIGNKSFVIDSVLVRKTVNGQELCAESKCVIVCMNYKEKKTIEVPVEWRTALEKFENT